MPDSSAGLFSENSEPADAQPADAELIDALRLNLVPGIGPRLHQALESAFGSPSAVLKAWREAGAITAAEYGRLRLNFHRSQRPDSRSQPLAGGVRGGSSHQREDLVPM